jgi:hypothetical protein
LSSLSGRLEKTGDLLFIWQKAIIGSNHVFERRYHSRIEKGVTFLKLELFSMCEFFLYKWCMFNKGQPLFERLLLKK